MQVSCRKSAPDLPLANRSYAAYDTASQEGPEEDRLGRTIENWWAQPAKLTAEMLTVFFAAIFLFVVAGLAIVGTLPFAVLALYVVASLFASLAYGVDKLAASENGRRIPESTLHLLGLIGGWPGALVARHFFRHKTKKQRFIVAFWATVVLNCCALGWMLSPPGQRFLMSLLGKG